MVEVYFLFFIRVEYPKVLALHLLHDIFIEGCDEDSELFQDFDIWVNFRSALSSYQRVQEVHWTIFHTHLIEPDFTCVINYCKQLLFLYCTGAIVGYNLVRWYLSCDVFSPSEFESKVVQYCRVVALVYHFIPPFLFNVK